MFAHLPIVTLAEKIIAPFLFLVIKAPTLDYERYRLTRTESLNTVVLSSSHHQIWTACTTPLLLSPLVAVHSLHLSQPNIH